MKILFVDTTTADLVVAILDENGTTNVSEKDVGTHHSEKLCQKVQQALHQHGASFADLDAYACAIGPGSFTGIRIGVSTVKGYATAHPKPFVAVNTLHAIANSANCGKSGKAVIDAGNGWYFADLANGVEPCLVAYDDARVVDAGKCQGGLGYLDGSLHIVEQKFQSGQFDQTLTPLYIRRSQAEENKK